MSLSQWKYRTQCRLLTLRGKRRWMLATSLAGVAVLLTGTLIAIPAIFDTPTSGTTPGVVAASAGSWTDGLWWRIGLGFAVFIVGVVGNVAANALQRSIDAVPRDALAANQNHHLASLVGEAVRVILLLLVDSKPPPEGMAKEEFPHNVTEAAKGPLTDMAAAATDFWRGRVLDPDPNAVKPFAGLHEPTLSTFIIDPKAPAMDPEAWKRFLNELHLFAKARTGNSAVPFANRADLDATVATLGAQFGRSFREALKWDSTHDGLGWAAMQLQIAGQLLMRAGNAGGGSPGIDAALAGLRDAYDAGFKELSSKIDKLEASSARRHRAMLARMDRQHAQVMGALKCLSEQAQAVQRGVDAITANTAPLPVMAKDVADIQARLNAIQSGQLSATTIKTTGNLAAAKVAPNQFFTGRTDELARLHAALKGGSVAIVHALTGEGGIGKTELAKVYALIYADTYDSVWWIDASTAALRGELVKVYERATGTQAPQNAQVDALCQALVDHWKGTRPLVVLDNVDDAANFTLFSSLPTVRILATTRQHHKTKQGVEPFALGVLPPADAVALMRKEIAKHRDDVTDADLTAIATELDGHALAVALAGAYLANYHAYSARDVLAKLQTSKVGDVDLVADEAEHDALGLEYRKSVAASLSLSFVLPEVAAALPLLAAASFLHPTGITIEWLMAGTGWDRDKVIKAARTLATYSIIKNEKTISVHRLTQGVARARADVAGGEAGAAVLDRLLTALIDLFMWPATPQEQLVDHVKTPARLAATAHAEAVIGHAEAAAEAASEGGCRPAPPRPSPALQGKAARLRAELAKWFPDVGLHADAERHLNAAIDWGEAQSPRDERGLAIRYASRASIRQSKGDLAGAEADLQKSIDWGEAQSPRHERTLAVWYASRASIRQDRGDLAGAEADIQKSIDWGEAQSPRDERSLAIRHASRASIRQSKGDLAGAEADLQKSIDWGEAQSPRDERGLAIWSASRASIRQYRGDLAGAEADLQKSIDWGEAQSPRDERGLAICYASRASIRQDRGDLAGAEADLQKSIDWGEAQSPRDQRSLAIDYASRARIREAQALAARRDGDAAKAAVLFAQAKADIARTLAWWEKNMLNDERGLAIIRRDQTRIDAAAKGE